MPRRDLPFKYVQRQQPPASFAHLSFSSMKTTSCGVFSCQQVSSVPLAASCGEACPIRCIASGVGIFWRAYGRTHPQGVIPSCCCVRARGLVVLEEIDRAWFTPSIRVSFLAAAAEQQCSIGMFVRGGRRHHRPNCGTVQLRRQEAGFDYEGRGRQNVDQRGRD